MTLPTWLQAILPGDTATTWETLAPVIPDGAHLVGGTAVAVHLRHRISHDLDFFLSRDADLDVLRGHLERLGSLAVADHTDDTLNGLFEGTRLQFLDARSQRVLECPLSVEGIQVAGLGDLLATKLKVIGDRGELRDYYDVQQIETAGGRMVEEGLGLFVERYRPRDADTAVRHIVRGLGYFDDVGEDPGLPASRGQIVAYWHRRQPEVTRALG